MLAYYTDRPRLLHRYPFRITSAVLARVGAKEAWPALLASLTWLIELLEYDAATMSDAQSAGEEAEFFFGYLQNAYTHFLRADDDAVEALDGQVSESFGERFAALESELSDMEAGNAALKAKLQQLRDAESPIPALEARKADYDSDISKFKELIEQLTARHDAALAKEAERRAELASATEREGELKAELQAVKAAVASQELSQADVEALKAKKARLKEAQAAAESARASVQGEVYAAESQLSSALTDLESCVGSYHDKAGSLGLLAPDDHNAGGMDFELRVNASALGCDEEDLSASFGPASARVTGGVVGLLGADVKGSLLPGLHKLKAEVAERVHRDRTLLLSLQDAVEEASEATEEWVQAKAALQKRVTGLEESLASEKAAALASMETYADDMADLESMLAEARQYRDSMVKLAAEVSPAALERTKREVDRAIAAMAAEKESVVSSLVDTAQSLVQHKQHVQARVQHVQGLWTRKLADVRASIDSAGSTEPERGSKVSTSAAPGSPVPVAPPAAAATPVQAPITPQQAASAARRASLRSAKRTPAGTPALASPPMF